MKNVIEELLILQIARYSNMIESVAPTVKFTPNLAVSAEDILKIHQSRSD